MQVRTGYVFLDFTGTPLKVPAEFDAQGKISKTRDMTFAIAATESLLGQYPSETITAAEKLARYEMAKRISNSIVVELTIDEAAKIKTCVNMNYTPLVVGLMHDCLENAGTEAVRGHQQPQASPRVDDQFNDKASSLPDGR